MHCEGGKTGKSSMQQKSSSKQDGELSTVVGIIFAAKSCTQLCFDEILILFYASIK